MKRSLYSGRLIYLGQVWELVLLMCIKFGKMMQKREDMMHNFGYRETMQFVGTDVLRMVTHLHEMKGRVEAQSEAAPKVMDALMGVARVQSTEASNRIEGIITTNARLKALMQQKTTPRNRSEEEIAGYRDVLATVHESHDYIEVVPNNILQMHRDLYSYSGRGGEWKAVDNQIVETDREGKQSIRFVPVPAFQTGEAVEQLCRSYREAVCAENAPPLLLIPMFVLDFLCIHPFADGNGRMSRLLTALLLYRSGYDVGRYVSLEKQIDNTKTEYYEALQLSSEGWHENKNDYAPFVRYFLGMLIKAYTELVDRLKLLAPRTRSKAERVRAALETSLKPLSKAEVAEKCPDVSLITIERTLKRMLDDGKLTRIGQGRTTKYVKISLTCPDKPET